MLWTIFVILVVLWFLSLMGNFGGTLIHLLLAGAAIVLVLNWIVSRRKAI